MKSRTIAPVEDPRVFNRLLARLHHDYPPAKVQHEADLATLARCNWQAERLANLLDTDISHRLSAPILQKIADPSIRLLKATRRAFARREHQLLLKQSEANLRSTNTVITRVEKWNSSR
jgi:hypothetical protein